jgi:hypothetical protein
LSELQRSRIRRVATSDKVERRGERFVAGNCAIHHGFLLVAAFVPLPGLAEICRR